jgi:hypothetical protein
VVSTNPAGSQTGVALDSSVEVTFDLDMDPAATASSISISPAVGGGSAAVSGKVLTWMHASPFAEQTLYTVTISTAAKSVVGVALPAAHQFVFLTTTVPTGSPPKVTSTQPADGESGVSLASPVFVIFDHAMDPATAAFSIDPPTAGAVNVTGMVLKFVASVDLPAQTKHTVKVGPGAKGSNGVSLGAELLFTFTTKEKLPPPPPPPDNKTGPGESGKILGLDTITFSILAGALVVVTAVAMILLVRRRRRPAIEERPKFFGGGQ